jgi:FixJ family two-component response regulator
VRLAISAEFCLLDAGAAVVKIANSMASAKSILDEGISFDVAVVDLLLADGNASTLAQVLSERGIAVVIATGDVVCEGQPAHSKAITILQKPYTDRDLINALMRCAAAAPVDFHYLTIEFSYSTGDEGARFRPAGFHAIDAADL